MQVKTRPATGGQKRAIAPKMAKTAAKTAAAKTAAAKTADAKAPRAARTQAVATSNVVPLRAAVKEALAPKAVAVQAARKTPKAKKAVPGRQSAAAAAAAAAPAVPALSQAQREVRIFQIFYDDWHAQLLDPEFEPYDNRGVVSELHEFGVFENIAESGRAAGAKYWGALSWRFGEKTGIDGKAWREAMAAKPGYDAYFCNPFPANEALYHNVWAQGQTSHPGFLGLARAFFEAAALPLEQLNAIQPSNRFTAANYFVATPAFWDAYLQFVRRALGNAERKLAPKMRALLHSRIADPQGFHFGSTYVPFIVERLFPVFLATEGAQFKTFKVPLPEREKELNVHTKLLRQMRDVAHKGKSPWMAACWVNYRNLYLAQTNGRDWCKKHLRSITPVQVSFA